MPLNKARLDAEHAKTGRRYLFACGVKVKCPSCNHKRFVPIIDYESAEIFEEYGRCDREEECGYINMRINSDVSYFKPRRSNNKPEVVSYPSEEILNDYKYLKTSEDFEQKFITSCFGKYLQSIGATRKELSKAVEWFGLGRNEGGTIFPSYNANGRLARFKFMRYKANGHRTKYISYLPKGNYEKGCFGFEHVRDAKEVHIVESEKTAVLGFIQYWRKHEKLSCWIATGGANGLTASYVEALKGKKVYLYPDADEAGRNAFLEIFGKLAESAYYKDLFPKRTDGYDIGDYIVNKWKNKTT